MMHSKDWPVHECKFSSALYEAASRAVMLRNSITRCNVISVCFACTCHVRARVRNGACTATLLSCGMISGAMSRKTYQKASHKPTSTLSARVQAVGLRLPALMNFDLFIHARHSLHYLYSSITKWLFCVKPTLRVQFGEWCWFCVPSVWQCYTLQECIPHIYVIGF